MTSGTRSCLLDPANRLLLLAANANRIMTLPQVLSGGEWGRAVVLAVLRDASEDFGADLAACGSSNTSSRSCDTSMQHCSFFLASLP